MLEKATITETGSIINIHIPMLFKRRGGRKEIILPEGIAQERPPTALQLALARAFKWQKMLDIGEVESLGALSAKLDMDKPYLSKMLRLPLLAPDIVEAILDGNEPSGLSLTQLLKSVPLCWKIQCEKYAFTD